MFVAPEPAWLQKPPQEAARRGRTAREPRPPQPRHARRTDAGMVEHHVCLFFRRKLSPL